MCTSSDVRAPALASCRHLRKVLTPSSSHARACICKLQASEGYLSALQPLSALQSYARANLQASHASNECLLTLVSLFSPATSEA